MPQLQAALTTYLLNPKALAACSVFGERRARRKFSLAGKTVLMTGASSGLGRAAAGLLAAKGAEVILVARGLDDLVAVRAEIEGEGGKAHVLAADLTDGAAVDALVESVVSRFGAVDVLVNNAGRSIRRKALDAVDRFHDYERTTALNYYGAARLTLGLLPSMLAAGGGHIVNILTWGVAVRGGMPMFSAYGASKAALGSFGRSLDAECRRKGVRVSSLYFPLIRTGMIAPTAKYDAAPALAVDQAAGWVLRAIETKTRELYPRFVGILRAISAVSPTAADAIVTRII